MFLGRTGELKNSVAGIRAIGKSLSLTTLLCVFASCPVRGQWPASLAADRVRLAGSLRYPLWSDSVPATAKLGPVLILPPQTTTTWNSAIPYSLNDGPLWAGKGLNLSVSAGVAWEHPTRHGSVRLALAPTVLYSQNLPFVHFPYPAPDRLSYANPFHGPGASADLPLRFGDRHLLRFDPGRSAAEFRREPLVLRLTAANDWWGPGIRNTLVVSDNAPGIPRVELASSPLATRIGEVTATAIAGTLTESNFFDAIASDYRSISGLRVALRPDSALTVGLARVVYAVIESPVVGPLAHSLDVLWRWDAIPVLGDTLVDGRRTTRSDQITSLFARWVFPDAGLEVYGEWARTDLPRSFTELLVAPHHSGAFVIGTQYATPVRARALVRLQVEFTNLEQSTVFPNRPPTDYYTSLASPQGYTQRGQVIGAAIGPGGSSQWLALDWIAPRWQAGLFGERTRWENDALYRQPAPNFARHDVTLAGGVRGGWRTRLTDFTASATLGYRFNFLFQNGYANPGGYRTVDVRNVTIRLAATPR